MYMDWVRSSVLVVGMQDMMRIAHERDKAEGAKGFLDDANVQMDGLACT